MSEIKVGLLLQGRVISADDGGDGFDVEEEVLVGFGYLGFTSGHNVIWEMQTQQMGLLTVSL